MLPSYRRLAGELNVTMASIQGAMADLEREGLIRRERGRGVFPRTRRRPARTKRLPLQCINLVVKSFDFAPSFVEGDYLAGYTKVLDDFPSPVRMRFVAGEELNSDYDGLLSKAVPVEAQGAVLVNWSSAEITEWFQRNAVPFVVQYHSQYASENLPPHFGVYVNKAGGASQAVNHLLELGHRDIGFLGPVDLDPDGGLDPNVLWEGTPFEGYRSALVCSGLHGVKDYIADCWTKEGRESFGIAKAYLQRSRRPTAVLAGCDEIARSLLKAARALNIRVPEDLSVVGFNNQPDSDKTAPPLTTISIPRRELAGSAVALLMEAVKQPRVPPRTRILETHLIIRETTAPPPAERAGNSGKLSSRAVLSE